MGKKLDQDKIFSIVKLFEKYPAVVVRGFFIIGMPEETSDTLNQTYEMIRQIKIDCPEINNLIPFKGTKIFDQAQRDNLFFEKVNHEDLWKIPISLTDRDKFFIKPYNLNEVELKQWRIKFNTIMS
jgi:radical SAM superfamily enzyme YgiQ (UPF0313 family)